MVSVVKNFNLILLFLVLSFGSENFYCSGNVGGNENFDGYQVGQDAVEREIISGLLYFFSVFIVPIPLFVVPNFAYWLFNLYQKKPGWYFYKYYYCVGYRTRLYHKIFYLDFYLRFFILRLVSTAICLFVAQLLFPSSTVLKDERVYKTLFVVFSPDVDLNIRLAKKFYLVIGFKDIFIFKIIRVLFKSLGG